MYVRQHTRCTVACLHVFALFHHTDHLSSWDVCRLLSLFIQSCVTMRDQIHCTQLIDSNVISYRLSFNFPFFSLATTSILVRKHGLQTRLASHGKEMKRQKQENRKKNFIRNVSYAMLIINNFQCLFVVSNFCVCHNIEKFHGFYGCETCI